MPVPVWSRPRGRIEEIVVRSDVLRDNVFGDPAERSVAVYLPEGYDATDADYPLFVDLIGFTGSGFSHLNWKAYEASVPQRIDALVAEGRMGPVVCAFPDCFTTLGGNQYIDSAAMGRWATWLTTAMIPAIEARFRVRRGARHRAVFGKSSGGYGAIAHGMLHGEHWGAVASHSGDMAFDLCYRPHLPEALDRIAKHGGTIAGLVEALLAAPKVDGTDLMAVMTLAMAATYDPDPTAPYGVRLPVDLHTGRLDEAAWARWLAWDPVEMVERSDVQDRLRALRGIWIDCGWRDQYFLHYGARQLVQRLDALGIAHRYEEFDDNHSSVDYRMDLSLPFLYDAVSGG